jgi:DNA-binding transcriptional ArsR family regulator
VRGVFEALGEPVRRLILELLAAGEQPVGQLVAALRTRMPISQPAVSQHLKVLLDANLVSVRPSGTRRLYALDRTGLDAAQGWLAQLADPLSPFTQPLDALATEVARGRRASRAAAAEPAAAQPPGERDSRSALAAKADRAGHDASSSRIDSPYLLSFDSPTPLIPASSARDDGAATAIARSVASWKTT